MSRGDSVLATRCIGQALGALVGASAAPTSTEFETGDTILFTALCTFSKAPPSIWRFSTAARPYSILSVCPVSR